MAKELKNISHSKQKQNCIKFILAIDIVVFYLVDSVVATNQPSSSSLDTDILSMCLIDILQGDDIALTEVIMSLENKYEITIPETLAESWLNCQTIPQIADAIIALKK